VCYLYRFISCSWCILVHLIGLLHVSFGAKSVRVRSAGIQRGHPDISAWPISAGSLPNLMLLTESRKWPELSSHASEVLTVTDVHQIQEVCESDGQNSKENVSDGSWAEPTEERSHLRSSNPTLLHFESENDVNRVTNSGDTTHGSDTGQQDEVTSDSSSSTCVADSDSFILYIANERSSDIPLKQDALCYVTGAQSQLGVNTNTVLFNSDPNLLHSWRAENAQNFLSASLEMLPISSPDVSPSCSVTSLPLLSENGSCRRHNGFFLVKPKSQALGLKTDQGVTFSSLPNLFNASNKPEQSRLKYIAGAKESEEKPRQKEEIIQIPKSYHVMKATDVNHKERLQTAGTAASAVIMRNEGMEQMHTVGPQEAVDALYDNQWKSKEFKKMSCSHIATFELTSPLNRDKKLLPYHSRSNYSPASFRKFLQQLSLWCQQGVMSAYCLQTMCCP